jgi:predicted dehydrogenase
MANIRLGVVGVARGRTFMGMAEHTGMELVALCDTWEEKLVAEGEKLGVATYTDYDAFLDHGIDAVVLANYYHQHAPFAIKALKKGIHVMSECQAVHTLGEASALARAVQDSGCTYMFAENYPYMVYNQEMKRLFDEGFVGKFLYGEGEYVHPDPADVKIARSQGLNHWRNWIPATYYCTHSLAPVMYITDTRPVSVSAFVMEYDSDDPTATMHTSVSDTAAIIMCRMDNGAVVKSLHGALRGHGNYVRIHGNKGLMENDRIGDRSRLKIYQEPFDTPDGEKIEKVYQPEFPAFAAKAKEAGHGGGDFFTSYHFAEAIRTGTQPYLDVYKGIDMSICGIQGWRSALEGGIPVDIPDFRDEAIQKEFENDNWSPDPDRAGPGQPAASILGELTPSDEAKAFARKIWDDQGFKGE